MKEIEKACITCKHFNSIDCDEISIGECDFHDTFLDETFFDVNVGRLDKLLVRSNYSCIYWEYYLED